VSPAQPAREVQSREALTIVSDISAAPTSFRRYSRGHQDTRFVRRSTVR